MTAQESPTTSARQTVSATAVINAPLRPDDRLERFEEMLTQVYRTRLPGCEVTGGGTLTQPDGEPAWCDLELTLAGEVDHAVEVTTLVLSHLGAPRGSRLTVAGREPVEIGSKEGVTVYLNGTDLPAEVYATSDVNVLIEAFSEAARDPAALYSWWEGPRETALHFFAESADDLEEALRAEAARHPLAQGCRIVRRPTSPPE